MYLTRSKPLPGISLLLSMILLYLTFVGNQIPVQAQLLDNQSENVTGFGNQNNQTNKNNLNTLAKEIEDRLEKASIILESTAKLPEMRHTSFANMFNSSINGIPKEADLEKRQIAQSILSEYPNYFVSVLFTMPNGTVYMLEPFERQLNLSTYDLSQRDYYQGVINTKDTFLGNTIISASSGLKQAQLAVPVFENSSTSLVGVLSSGLNFKTFNDLLQSFSATSQERVLLVDSIGVKIADSDSQLVHRNESFDELQGYKYAINGQSGSVVETVNETEMLVSYYPVEAGYNTWILLSLLPYDNDNASDSSLSVDSNNIIKNAEEEITIQNSSISGQLRPNNTSMPTFP